MDKLSLKANSIIKRAPSFCVETRRFFMRLAGGEAAAKERSDSAEGWAAVARRARPKRCKR